MADTPLLFDVDEDSNEDTSGIFTPPESSSLTNGNNSLFTESFVRVV